MVIPDNVSTIENFAFYNCVSLTNVSIPDSVTSIGSHAFRNCVRLKSVTLPRKLNTIGNLSFSGCTSLSKVTIPGSVKTIWRESFDGCTNLSTVDVGDGVESIENYAFRSCTSLTSITIPESVSSIGEGAFSGCSSLSKVFYLGSQNLSVFGSDVFDKKRVVEMCVPPDYNSSSFCGVSVTLDNEECQTFSSMFNHCFKVAFENNNFVWQKRNNATEMENERSYGCVQYRCVNETGEGSKELLCGAEPESCLSCVCNETDGKQYYVKSETWEEMKRQGNRCYDIVCEDSEWAFRKMENVATWERHSNHCYECLCDNSSGLTCRKRSNATEWENKTDGCMRYFCDNETGPETKMTEETCERIYVSAEVEKGKILNTTSKEDMLKSIKETIGTESESESELFDIGWECDEDGYVIRLFILVDDEEKGRRIVEKLEECETS